MRSVPARRSAILKCGSQPSSTAEAEVVAFADGIGDGKVTYDPDVVISMSTGIRQEGLPIQQLFRYVLGVTIPIEMQVDNDQCLIAVEKGYSKRLRQLARTHRVSIGVLHEISKDKQLGVTCTYCPTSAQKADIYTKALPPATFAAARAAINDYFSLGGAAR